MTKRKTNEEFKREVYDLVGNEYTFLEYYQGALTKIRVNHNKCSHTYSVEPNAFLHGSRCPYCAKEARKKTNTKFKQEVYNLVGNDYVFLDNYVNRNTKLRVKHEKCGNVYEVRPYNFLVGKRCPYCYGNAKKTDKQFKQEVIDLVGNDYTFLEPYVNNNTKLKVKHNKCGNIYEVIPANFIGGHRCPHCFGTPKKIDKEFKHEINILVGNDYVFLEHYQGADTKIKVKHNKCGNTYEVTPNHFLTGYRCPYCNSPKGELIIDKILRSLKINYEVQKTFDDLKDKSCLSYDFYVPSQNILIEYQGKQHYQPINYFGGETKFKNQQKHDLMKLGYAKEHGYTLITVPYTEDTLPKIKKYLIKHGLNYKG